MSAQSGTEGDSNSSSSPDVPGNTALAANDFTPDPKIYQEAHRSPDAAEWTAAELQELAALIANATWTLIKYEPNTPKLHSKWVYKKKRDSSGAVERYKARLVASGNEQALTEEGVEIVLVFSKGMGVSKETLAKLGADNVEELGLRLDSSLYGLKQAGRLWYQLLHRPLVQSGFKQCVTDSYMYFKADSSGTTLVGTNVDNLLVTGTSTERVDEFFADMQVLALKDLAPATMFLGVSIEYEDKSGYSFGQKHAIEELLQRFGLAQAHSVRCPIASAASATSSAGLVSSTVVTSAPESTARLLPAASAGLVSSTPSSTRRTSPQATKAPAGSASKSARKSPAKAAAGSSRRAPRNSAASPRSTSVVAPAPSITGSTRSQRASALNSRAINNLELQALEASDAEVLGWSSGATNSAARATSASSPLVVSSPSPPAVTPTPAPAEASSSQHQSSSDDSTDDEVVLQRSRRLRRKSVVESDESSDSVAEALEEKPASPLTPASVPPTPSTGQKRPSSPVTPASTKKARANASAKSSSSPRPVAKSTSRVRPTAKSSKAAKSATKTARGAAKSGKSAKSADPPTPASGQSASASGTAAVSAPTSSASSVQAPNSARGQSPETPACRPR
ncbi:unnamed protein product [Phytophthora fragariaefolia]|uniref:Unnamed protein product n=1 Tax=Phytophthora fragariaefolia TaxID=1490495 RepID=A0A9W6XRK0_9STRA|nr:unnamed protein product [Phytophthora fragariaefolia]